MRNDEDGVVLYAIGVYPICCLPFGLGKCVRTDSDSGTNARSLVLVHRNQSLTHYDARSRQVEERSCYKTLQNIGIFTGGGGGGGV